MSTNFDINVNTIVEDEGVQQLYNLLQEMADQVYEVLIDGSSAEEASGDVDGLQESLEGIDGSAAQEAADDVKGIGDAASESTGEVDDLTASLGGIAALGTAALYEDMAMSASSYNDQIKAMGNNLGDDAAAKQMASALGDVAKQYGVSGSSARAFGNQLLIAGVTGESTMTGLTKSAQGLAFNSGQSFEAVSGSMNKMIQTGRVAPASFKAMGTTIDEVAATAGISVDELKEKIKNMTPAERAEYLNSVLSQMPEVTAGAEDTANSYEKKLNDLEMASGGLKRRLGEMIIPTLTMFFEGLTWVLGGVIKVIDALPGPVKSVLGGLLGLVGAVVIASGFLLTLAGVVKRVKEAIELLKNIGFIRKAGMALLEYGKRGLTAGKNALIGAYNFVKSAALRAGSYAADKLSAAGRALLDYGKMAIDAGKRALTGAYNFVKASLIKIGAWVRETGAKVAATISNWALAASEWAVLSPMLLVVIAVVALVAILLYLYKTNDTVKAGIDGLIASFWSFVDYLKTIPGAIVEFATSLITWISSLPGVIWTYLLFIITSVIEWGSSIVSNGRSAASSFVTGVVNFIKNLPGRIGAFLAAVIGRVISWASNLISRGRSAASSFVSSIVSQVTSLPQRVYNAIFGVIAKVRAVFTAAWETAKGIFNNIMNLRSQADAGFNTGFDSGFVTTSPFDSGMGGSNLVTTNKQSETTIINNFNSLITDRDVANFIIDTVESHYSREATRS